MLKLQTENITSALGSKISSQQRVFQEAVDKQEKAFQKISDRFVSQIDQTRVKLESLTKESQTSIQGDLENFKRDLSKELEQHRAQINKTVVPVAKFIEDKNTNPPEKIKKEAAFEKPVKNATVAAVAAPVADNSGLKNLILANLAIVVIGLGILLTVVFAQAERIEKLQAQITDLATNTAKSTGTTSGGNTSTSVPSPTSSGTAPATGTTSPPGQQ